MKNNSVTIKFKMIEKAAVEPLLKIETSVLNYRKDFDQKMRDLRKDNYVLEFQVLNDSTVLPCSQTPG